LNSIQLANLKKRFRYLLARINSPDRALPDSLEWALKTNSLEEVKSYFAEHSDPVELASDEKKHLEGTCYVCSVQTRFQYSASEIPVNWRETLRCEHCGLINRWRSVFHLFQQICHPFPEDNIYLTEAVTPLYRLIKNRYPNTSGSEFDAGKEPGTSFSHHGQEVQVEDVTNLTYADKQFSAVLSFDVLEHVPNYRRALREFRRVLKPGGRVLISVPFTFRQDTEIRAQIGSDGEVIHLMPAQYHGDPMTDEGVLCYQVFGMNLLSEMLAAGFRRSFLCAYHSASFGYLDHNILFVGRR